MRRDIMMRLEQLRAEMIDRFERVDRRFAQNEQRLSRIDQRAAELSERIEVLFGELTRQIDGLRIRDERHEGTHGRAAFTSSKGLLVSAAERSEAVAGAGGGAPAQIE
jgi:hypothetical protein